MITIPVIYVYKIEKWFRTQFLVKEKKDQNNTKPMCTVCIPIIRVPEVIK